ncbi:hypothetical protein RUM43_012831 [Polyplax serrata]|uniref:Uncharacterized protein n=1 Tax=Polyplax serrata TaxID=468196 RepID=A0AAN8S9Q7_POLSC
MYFRKPGTPACNPNIPQTSSLSFVKMAHLERRFPLEGRKKFKKVRFGGQECTGKENKKK